MNFEIKEEIIDKTVDGAEGEETTVYKVFEDGTKEFACSFWKPKETESAETELTPAEQQEARETYIMAML